MSRTVKLVVQCKICMNCEQSYTELQSKVYKDQFTLFHSPKRSQNLHQTIEQHLLTGMEESTKPARKKFSSQKKENYSKFASRCSTTIPRLRTKINCDHTSDLVPPRVQRVHAHPPHVPFLPSDFIFAYPCYPGRDPMAGISRARTHARTRRRSGAERVMHGREPVSPVFLKSAIYTPDWPG